MMAKLIALLSTASLICILIAIIIYQRLSFSGVIHRTLDAAAVVKEVRQLNDLVTVRYSIEKVVGMKEQKSPLGSESILLLVQGKVLAGINLSALSSNDVTVRSRQPMVVRLPQPSVEEAFLDEKNTKVWDRNITWWTPWVSPDIDLEHKARMQAIDDIRQAALQMGILDQARRNAETSIGALLQAFGMQKPVFDYSS